MGSCGTDLLWLSLTWNKIVSQRPSEFSRHVLTPSCNTFHIRGFDFRKYDYCLLLFILDFRGSVPFRFLDLKIMLKFVGCVVHCQVGIPEGSWAAGEDPGQPRSKAQVTWSWLKSPLGFDKNYIRSLRSYGYPYSLDWRPRSYYEFQKPHERSVFSPVPWHEHTMEQNEAMSRYSNGLRCIPVVWSCCDILAPRVIKPGNQCMAIPCNPQAVKAEILIDLVSKWQWGTPPP